MTAALEEAQKAAASGEVPVGAVITAPDGREIARAGNRVLADKDPTAHAEILALRMACAALGTERLDGYTLTVTLEPCPMCAGAIAAARIATLVFGAFDPKSGGVDHGPRVFDHATCHHRPDIVSGLAEPDCAALLKTFFADRR